MPVEFLNKIPVDKDTIKQIVHDAIANGKRSPNMKNRISVNLPTAILAVDTAYQTEERMNHYAGLSAKIWDYRKYEDIRCSYRDGYVFVFEGSHRSNTAIEKGIKELDATLYLDLTQEDEIMLFLEQYDNRAKLSWSERFYAQLNANKPNPIIVDINETLLKHNFCIPKRGKKRVSTIHYINAIERFVKHFVAAYVIDFEKGHEELEWFLSMLTMVQWHLQDCTKKEHIKGFTEIWMLYAPQGKLKEAERNLRQVLTFLGPTAIRREADRLIPRKSTNFETRVATLLMNIANGQYILIKNASYIDPDQTPNLDEYTLEDIDSPTNDEE